MSDVRRRTASEKRVLTNRMTGACSPCFTASLTSKSPSSGTARSSESRLASSMVSDMADEWASFWEAW